MRSRSADYLFITSADDARALWINPAGLGVIPEASIMAEAVVARPVAGDVLLGQWTLGFNTRGLSFGYQRDRFPGAPSNDRFRFGLGLGFERGAVGAAFTLYRSDRTERGLDLGLRYRANRRVELGAVLEHIGRPTVRGVDLPLAGILGLTWTPVAAVVQLSAETRIAEDVVGSGADLSYRLGGRLATRGRFPLGVVGALELDGDLGFGGFTLGLALGGPDQVVLASSVAPSPAAARFANASVTGIARRRPAGRQF